MKHPTPFVYNGKSARPWFDVRQYGAAGDGTTDDTAAITSAMNAALAEAAVAGGAEIFIPKGVYLVTAALPTINTHRVNVRGAGPQASVIKFNPTIASSCFTFQLTAASILSQCSIKGVGFVSTEATLKKIAIDLIDCDITIVEDIGVNTWTGATSTGLRVKGRDQLSVRRFQATADLPIDIQANPNSTISLDHAHFTDLYLIASGNPCINIATGLNLTQVTFDGYQAWVNGTYGLYWLDTTGVSASQGITIKNVRTESGSDVNAYSVYISHNSSLQDLLIENCLLDSGRKGIYLRKVLRTTLVHVQFPSGAREGINMSAASTDSLQLIDCFFQSGSTVSLTNMTKKWSTHKPTSGSPIEDTCHYAYDPGTATQLPANLFSGKVWAWAGDIANGGTKDIPASNNTGRSAAMIFITASDGTGAKREGGMMQDDNNGNVVLSGSANFVIGNVAAKLCVLHGGTTTVINNLGATCHVSIFVVWM